MDPVIIFARTQMSFDGREIDAVQALNDINLSPDYHAANANRNRIVRGIQNVLRGMRFAVPNSGVVDPATAKALVKLLGGAWRSYSWLDIYGKLYERVYA